MTDCSITTMDAEDVVDFNFSSNDVVNKIIMKVLYISINRLIRFFSFYKICEI